VLKEGDVVIQRGTNHAWSNRSDKPVLMLYVLIDGKFDDELQGHFGAGGH
jgi:quercetin dioxygenase-like cupin family protein